jgi:deazaflavin-dependent oxidoreductase (nitroreductase family)
MASWNDSLIQTFRSNSGALGGPWEGKTVILMHSVGRQTGKQYVHPLVAAPVGDTLIVCGTMGGSPTEPRWVGNLEAATPPVTIEIGDQTVSADFTVIRPGDPDWERLYQAWRDYWPDAADYEQKTDRKFPVVQLQIREPH